MSDIVKGLPNITGIGLTDKASGQSKSRAGRSTRIQLSQIQSSFGFALHMHQPTIPAATDDLRNSPLISNLQYMMEHQNIGDNHNAPVFMQCYSRMSDLIREIADQGGHPRVMLDYSGNLLWGLRQMEGGRVLENLKHITCDQKYSPYAEWLGTMWSHAVVTSTPIPDISLHMMAWRNHFASIFGPEAQRRVKGFSPPEMHLPIHPDVCYQYIKALKENGYEWLLVQEHTVENLDGSGIRRPHFPHRLVAKNSLGEIQEIVVLIKTQGSDTKLVAQMQPYYEAKTLSPQEYAKETIPAFVCQVGDGENGGVMMNEFPPAFRQAFAEIGTRGTVALNGSEYLECLDQAGVKVKDFIPIQPISQHRIWKHVTDYGPGACDAAIEKIRETDKGYNLDRGSWTNDRSWVKGYENILGPINALSAAFHEKFDGKKQDLNSPSYQEALLYLLTSQTSCFRYWGEGSWTDYAKEICRRGMAALKKA